MLQKKVQQNNFTIFLHDIRSVQNVASIFRLGDCIGVEEIVLSGVTPGPLDRFDRSRSDFTKISLGAESSVKWRRVESVEEFIQTWKAENASGVVVALEQDARSVDYKNLSKEISADKKYLIIPGREREGLESGILEMCEVIAEIPQYGAKESLNIFSSLSIVLYRWFDK
jgi:23S rRNA (guanosine2251-2'-O)-methyltransferase